MSIDNLSPLYSQFALCSRATFTSVRPFPPAPVILFSSNHDFIVKKIVLRKHYYIVYKHMNIQYLFIFRANVYGFIYLYPHIDTCIIPIRWIFSSVYKSFIAQYIFCSIRLVPFGRNVTKSV